LSECFPSHAVSVHHPLVTLYDTLLWSHLVMPCPADLTDQSRARHTNIMGCSISRATAGVVEATKTDAIRIAAKPVNSRPLEPRIWSVVSERLAQPPTRACVPIMHVWLCRGLVAMHEPPASYQVPWPRGYATVTPPSWVTAPSPKKEAPAVVKTPSMEKEKA